MENWLKTKKANRGRDLSVENGLLAHDYKSVSPNNPLEQFHSL